MEDPPLVPISAERQKEHDERPPPWPASTPGCEHVPDFDLPYAVLLGPTCHPTCLSIYNNDFQIVQSPGYVIIAPEMIHSARIIPVDGRPHIGKNIHQWLGDSRGHWEGNTLVLETTNFRPERDHPLSRLPSSFFTSMWIHAWD